MSLSFSVLSVLCLSIGVDVSGAIALTAGPTTVTLDKAMSIEDNKMNEFKKTENLYKNVKEEINNHLKNESMKIKIDNYGYLLARLNDIFTVYSYQSSKEAAVGTYNNWLEFNATIKKEILGVEKIMGEVEKGDGSLFLLGGPWLYDDYANKDLKAKNEK